MTPTCLILAKDKHCGSVCCGLKLCRWAGEKHTANRSLSVRENIRTTIRAGKHLLEDKNLCV